MKGRIKAESTLGVGSSFELRLPFVESADTGIKPGANHPLRKIRRERPLAGVSILVAEDEEFDQMLLRASLTENGARIVMVGNGREALERIVGDGPGAYDLVLMDIQMPEMNGYEASRRIRELAPDLPIIAQTAHALDVDHAECVASGMVAHIAKPYSPSDLVKLVTQVLAATRTKRFG